MAGPLPRREVVSCETLDQIAIGPALDSARGLRNAVPAVPNRKHARVVHEPQPRQDRPRPARRMDHAKRRGAVSVGPGSENPAQDVDTATHVALEGPRRRACQQLVPVPVRRDLMPFVVNPPDQLRKPLGHLGEHEKRRRHAVTPQNPEHMERILQHPVADQIPGPQYADRPVLDVDGEDVAKPLRPARKPQVPLRRPRPAGFAPLDRRLRTDGHLRQRACFD